MKVNFLSQKWVPLYGFKRAAAEREKDWVLEIPENADPFVDRFADKSALKKEKVAKNEFQRLRNIAAARKIKVPRMGILPADKLPSDQVGLYLVFSVKRGLSTVLRKKSNIIYTAVLTQ